MVRTHKQVQFVPEVPTPKCRGARADHECYTEGRLPGGKRTGKNWVRQG